MSAEAILVSVREKYKSLSSYADEGTVEISGTGFEPTRFKTFFVRPNKIRFAWRQWHPYFGQSKPAHDNLIWCNEESSGSWFLDELRTQDKFSLYVAGATGVSSGSVHKILNLLDPNLLGLASNWQNMAEARTIGTETVNEQECHHIIGSGMKPEDTEAWIGCEDGLVHRLHEHLRLTESEIQEKYEQMKKELAEMGKEPPPLPRLKTFDQHFAYQYQAIQLNPSLDDELFKFNPATDSKSIFSE